MHFLGEQFQCRKILPQRDFAAGGFPLADAWKAATTPRVTAEGQVPGNDLSILGTPLENFLGISSGGEILASQAGSSGFLYRRLPSGMLSPPITTRYVFPSL